MAETEFDTLVRLRLGCVPDSNELGPLLMQGGTQNFLTFRAVLTDPVEIGDGTGTAVVDIVGCVATHFGSLVDRTTADHHIDYQNLLPSTVYEVIDSAWRTTNASKLGDNAMTAICTAALRHFVFVFREGTFECLAEGISLSYSLEQSDRILARLCESILRRD